MYNNYLKYFFDEKYQLNHQTTINITNSTNNIKFGNEKVYICPKTKFKLLSNIENKTKLNAKARKEYIIPCKTKGPYIKTFDHQTNLVIYISSL